MCVLGFALSFACCLHAAFPGLLDLLDLTLGSSPRFHGPPFGGIGTPRVVLTGYSRDGSYSAHRSRHQWGPHRGVQYADSCAARLRSQGRRTGRFTRREATLSCWRSAAFSARSSRSTRWLGRELDESANRSGAHVAGTQNSYFCVHGFCFCAGNQACSTPVPGWLECWVDRDAEAAASNHFACVCS